MARSSVMGIVQPAPSGTRSAKFSSAGAATSSISSARGTVFAMLDQTFVNSSMSRTPSLLVSNCWNIALTSAASNLEGWPPIDLVRIASSSAWLRLPELSASRTRRAACRRRISSVVCASSCGTFASALCAGASPWYASAFECCSTNAEGSISASGGCARTSASSTSLGVLEVPHPIRCRGAVRCSS